MPLHCVEQRRSPTQLDDAAGNQGDTTSMWQEAPDSILLHIFSFLEARHLMMVSETCKVWNRVALDESLWRRQFRDSLGLPDTASIAPGKPSWRKEYQRVHYRSPTVLTETLTDHTDEVLHVSFAHKGHLFSTTSKDATLKVWSVGCPTTLKYSKDFRELLGWNFTQFSCFNESDTMVLVSSVKTTDYMDRRGYVAILSLKDGFEIARMVTMDPSQLFGAWLDDTTFLGGCLEISLDRFATTVQIEAYDVPEMAPPLPDPDTPLAIEEVSGRPLFTFSSETASLIKFLTVAGTHPGSDNNHAAKSGALSDIEASCSGSYEMTDLQHDNQSGNMEQTDYPDTETQTVSPAENKLPFKESLGLVMETHTNQDTLDCDIDNSHLDPKPGSSNVVDNIKDNDDYSSVICSECVHVGDFNDDTNIQSSSETDSNIHFPDRTQQRPSECSISNSVNNDTASGSSNPGKSLIFVTGEFAVALHQLGFKNVPAYSGDDLGGRTPDTDDGQEEFMVVNYSNNDIHIVRRLQNPDKPDNLIDLFGHVTGLCLSHDQRYLYINCRPWIGEVDRSDPWATPDLSPNIEIRVIDLLTLKDTGRRYLGHKGLSPSIMCCFVFLDVSQDYVASGSEDAKGYLWDSHYQVQLATFPHESGVVNAVGFNPQDQEYLVTVSDDGTIKIWRSRLSAKLFSRQLEKGNTE